MSNVLVEPLILVVGMPIYFGKQPVPDQFYSTNSIMIPTVYHGKFIMLILILKCIGNIIDEVLN